MNQFIIINLKVIINMIYCISYTINKINKINIGVKLSVYLCDQSTYTVSKIKKMQMYNGKVDLHNFVIF